MKVSGSPWLIRTKFALLVIFRNINYCSVSHCFKDEIAPLLLYIFSFIIVLERNQLTALAVSCYSCRIVC